MILIEFHYTSTIFVEYWHAIALFTEYQHAIALFVEYQHAHNGAKLRLDMLNARAENGVRLPDVVGLHPTPE
jgi:hypothetical protein